MTVLSSMELNCAASSVSNLFGASEGREAVKSAFLLILLDGCN